MSAESQTFSFLPQRPIIEGLLNACLAALPSLHSPEKQAMIAAMANFETATSLPFWSLMEVDPQNEYQLTAIEKREVLSRFVSSCGVTESDWMAIDAISRTIVAERPVSQ